MSVSVIDTARKTQKNGRNGLKAAVSIGFPAGVCRVTWTSLLKAPVILCGAQRLAWIGCLMLFVAVPMPVAARCPSLSTVTPRRHHRRLPLYTHSNTGTATCTCFRAASTSRASCTLPRKTPDAEPGFELLPRLHRHPTAPICARRGPWARRGMLRHRPRRHRRLRVGPVQLAHCCRRIHGSEHHVLTSRQSCAVPFVRFGRRLLLRGPGSQCRRGQSRASGRGS